MNSHYCSRKNTGLYSYWSFADFVQLLAYPTAAKEWHQRAHCEPGSEVNDLLSFPRFWSMFCFYYLLICFDAGTTYAQNMSINYRKAERRLRSAVSSGSRFTFLTLHPSRDSSAGLCPKQLGRTLRSEMIWVNKKLRYDHEMAISYNFNNMLQHSHVSLFLFIYP